MRAQYIPADMPERTTQILDLATRDFYAVPLAGTVEQAVGILRAAPDKAVFYCYALDEAGRLAGVVPVRKLLTAAPGTLVREISLPNVIALPAGGDRSLLEDFFATYRFLAFPVVDGDRRILGVVQADAFSDQIMGEYEGRVRHDWLASLGVSEKEGHARPFGIMRLRLPWLLFTVGSGLVSAMVAGIFHHTVEKLVALAFFVPVVLLVAESVGMQTSAVTVSSLSSDVPPSLPQLLGRETQAASLLGLACGLLVGGACWLWLGDVRFATVLTATMVLTVTTASALAVAVPGLFRFIGMDPALAAAPLTLAVTDNLTLFAYLGIASRLAG
jgi:magnesium transporter